MTEGIDSSLLTARAEPLNGQTGRLGEGASPVCREQNKHK